MTNTSLFNAALESTRQIWERKYQIKPVLNVRMPVLDAQIPVTIGALWTDRGLRPNSSNLAFLIQNTSDPDNLEQWKQRLKTLPVRGGLLVASNELHLLQSASESANELKHEIFDLTSWDEFLGSSKPYLFTPKALSQFREGQLSLADLEEEVSERSLIFLTRQQAQIENAFQKGIDSALKEVDVPKNPDSSRSKIKGHVIRYTIAYLAARILQDKNFFNSGDSIYNSNQDPRNLLKEMVRYTNGFFKRTMEESDPFINERVREQLAHYMGVYRVSFALTDHRDVGALYERAIKRLPPSQDLSGKEWSDLNRHYTPVKIAEKMLEALPLERLHPEERYIFDPAAGSGSLLLAATSRLAGMTDIPTDATERRAYLANHVAGNDRDEYAKLIAQLRYFLASESLSKVDGKITDNLPFPSQEQRNFTCEDYEILSRDDLPVKPKVIIANPPFIEEGKTQKAAKFVQKALEWLDDGSQFSFILPQSFLAATTLGFPEARQLLSERCQLLEIWQFPEHSVGIKAEQAVCVVSGIVGQSKKIFPVSSKAVFSRVKEEVKSIRENGFLGTEWLNQLDSENPKNRIKFWQLSVAPPVPVSVPTVLLGNLFYVFNGVNPGKFGKIYPPEGKKQFGIPYKRNWRLTYRDSSKLWADPIKVPEDKCWIRYGKDYLEGWRPENENLFDLHKILVARKVNRGSTYPLAAQLDDTGFCPDNNVFCVLPAADVNKYTSGYQSLDNVFDEWCSLTYEEKCLWLLGICTSQVANSLSLIGRKNHEITIDELCRLPLPLKVDSEIISITRQIIALEKARDPLLEMEINDLRETLDQLVRKSYGNPSWREITRVGKSSALDEWEREQKIKTKTTIGQVLEISEDNTQVYIYISRLMEDDNSEGEWIPLPGELPGWALDGTPFEAELSHDIKTFEQIRERPWALRKFRHEPRAYLAGNELDEFLRIPELEMPS